MLKRVTRLFLAGLVLHGASWANAQDVAPPADQGLLVVYGVLAPTREGDIDHRETIFFSVPNDLRDRVYVRIFDPEMSGDHDFRYGRYGATETVYRIVGGDGARTGIAMPEPVEDGAKPQKAKRADVLAARSGETLRETTFAADPQTDGQWVSIGAVRARQGEIIGDRAWFRLDVVGADGDDGNGFNVDVSLARDVHRRPEGLVMEAYQPTIRWPGGLIGTRVELLNPSQGPLIVQNFDGAAGDLRLNQMYSDIRLQASGQNVWVSEEVDTKEALLALTLRGGFETPNDVTLSVFDQTGQALPILMPPRLAPVPERPEAIPRARELADCRSVAFDGSHEGADALLAYMWDYGDGADGEEPVSAHSYTMTGNLEARLRVLLPGSRAARGAEATVPVHIRNAPVADAGLDLIVAPGDVVAFDGSNSVPSDSPITRYIWSFGDGEAEEGATAEHVYGQPGAYRSVLRVSDASSHPCNFGVATRLVTVNASPVAEAGTDQSTIVGRAITLDGAASYDVDGEIGTHSWDMGDGTVLEGARVTHVYDAPGIYAVALSVTDDSGVSNATSSDRLTIRVNAPPVPVIEGPVEPVAVGEAVVLDGSKSSDADGVILSHLWEFGDGSIGEGEMAEYAWAKPGVYNVVLSVTDNSGTTSATQRVSYEVVVNTRPVADAGPDQFVTASDVQFDGSASRDIDGQISGFVWDFGDGRSGSGPRPMHSFARPGTYEVALTVQDDSGAPQSTHRDTMTVVVNAAPIADAGPALTVAPGELFLLDAGASVDPDGRVVDHVWTFGDGGLKSGVRVEHSFDAPGLYRVQLAVTDDFQGGGAQDESEVLITVNDQPVAVAGPDLRIAPDESAVFDAAGSFDRDGSIGSYSWEFDDLQTPLEAARVERAWPTAGVYNVRLIVRDDSGVANATAQDSLVVQVNHRPEAEAGAVIDTDRLLVKLDAGGSSDADGDNLVYTWDFGDGSPPVFGREVAHVFPRAGQFPVTLWVDDGSGLSNARDVDATTVIINAQPVADAGGNRDVCSGESILFDASGSSDADGDLLRYVWDFGDGSRSDIINPTHTYEMPGTYPVTLSVADESGSARGTDRDRVAVIVQEGPIADAGPDMTVCVNQEVRMDGSGSTDADGSVNGFEWTFGDGSRASGATPVKSFERAGTYSVTLTITGDAVGQCSPLDTDTVTVEVLPAKTQEIVAVERAPVGSAVSFTAQLGDEAGTGDPVAFDWSFSDGGEASGQTASYTFAQPGEYLVTLTTTLEGGTQDCGQLLSRHKIVVNAAPEPLIDGPDSVATGALVSFDAGLSLDVDGVITNYLWDFGDGTTTTGVVGNHRYQKAGTYTLRLEVTDDADVANSVVVAERQITVNPVPIAGLDTPPALCVNTPRNWQVAAAEGVIVDWAFGDGQTASGLAVEHAFSKPGLYPVAVTTDDGRGLANSVYREEVYARVNAVPQADAGPDRTVCPGEEVAFTAGAYDADGAITDYIWTFSDGVELRGADVVRGFEASGPVEVTLSVVDDSGATCNTGQDTALILVNTPPSVDAGADQSTPVGAAHDVLRFDASTASDPDGQGVLISWDFGDGTSLSGAVARHRYASAGDYTVTVTARDSSGLACGVSTDTALVSATAREGGN
ncbi:PKD repeat protein [Shimia isoporae]|uniref:PKD repeat protein n=1 Tax=Shimia isoporae TaxID=647720 RepID=A0A4V2Q494_9RHOB|nr:PKD domain-containing protein [Shimia isoporae]TCL09880.1 PKD repeat protein [Shimia isoporae]